MKHLFIIHSFITEIVTLKVIDYLRLDVCNVFLFSDREYQIKTKSFKIYPLPNISLRFSKNPIVNQLTRKRVLKNLHKVTEGDDYILYLPHSWTYLFSLLISDRKCMAFNYIEEGLAAYMHSNFKQPSFSIKTIGLALILLSYKQAQLLRNGLFVSDEKLDKAYGLHEESFKPILNKRVMLKLNKDVNLQPGRYDSIIVFDALSIRKMIELDKILELLEDVIFPHIINSNLKSVAFKLHPDHFNKNFENEERVDIQDKLELFARNNSILLTEVGVDFSIEEYCSQSKTTLYTFVSSIGFYGCLLGSNSYTVRKRLYKLNPKIKSNAFIDSLMINI